MKKYIIKNHDGSMNKSVKSTSDTNLRVQKNKIDVNKWAKAVVSEYSDTLIALGKE